MKKNIKIVAVVPTFNSWKTLKPCINSLLKQSLKLRQIIVVNNGSTDSTYFNTKKFFPQVKLINLKINTGVVGGRNTGIKMLGKNIDFVLFFDHDMIAERKMIENLASVFSNRADCGIVTPKIYYLSNKSRIWSAGTGINLWTGQVLFRGGVDRGQFDEIERVQVAPAAMLVKNQTLLKVKRFDSKYFATYEDTDFCFRAQKNGFLTYYSPRAVAYHDIPDDKKNESERLLKRIYWVSKNRIIFMREFGNNFLIFLLFLPVYSVYYFRLALKFGSIKDCLTYLKGAFDGLTMRNIKY